MYFRCFLTKLKCLPHVPFFPPSSKSSTTISFLPWLADVPFCTRPQSSHRSLSLLKKDTFLSLKDILIRLKACYNSGWCLLIFCSWYWPGLIENWRHIQMLQLSVNSIVSHTQPEYISMTNKDPQVSPFFRFFRYHIHHYLEKLSLRESQDCWVYHKLFFLISHIQEEWI